MRISCIISMLIIYSHCTAQSHTLNFYITYAKKNNPLIQDYINQAEITTLDSLKLTGSLKPQIEFNSQVMLAPVINGVGYDSAVSNGGNYMALFSVSQQLFQTKTSNQKYEAIALQQAAVENTQKLSELDIEKTVTEQYISTYTSLSLLKYDEQAIALLTEQKLILKPLVDAGIYTQADYLNIVITEKEQSIKNSELLASYTTDLYQLNLLCGINDTAFTELESPAIYLDPDKNIPSIYMAHYAFDSLNLDIQKQLLNLHYKPRLSWFADAGLNSSIPSNAYKNFGFSVGLNLNIPIYDGNQKGYDKQTLDIKQNTVSAYKNQFETNYTLQKKLLNNQLQTTDALIIDYTEQLQNITALINFYKLQMQNGNLRITDFILTFNTLLSTQINLNEKQMAKLSIINALNYLNN